MFRVLLVLTLASASLAWTQSFPGDTVMASPKDITIELDSSQARNAGKSLGLALLGSAILPGAGEAYLQEEKSARNFFLVEAGFWASLFIALEARASYLQSARNYAAEYAGAPSSGMSAAYLENLANYRSYADAENRQDSYELNQVLSGVRNGNYAIPASDAWDFGSSNTPSNTAHWDEFQSIMRYYRGANITLSFAIGALALDRVVALAHTLRVYRRTSGKGLSFHVNPIIGPDLSGIRLALTF
jgi:hypothetical protein